MDAVEGIEVGIGGLYGGAVAEAGVGVWTGTACCRNGIAGDLPVDVPCKGVAEGLDIFSSSSSSDTCPLGSAMKPGPLVPVVKGEGNRRGSIIRSNGMRDMKSD